MTGRRLGIAGSAVAVVAVVAVALAAAAVSGGRTTSTATAEGTWRQMAPSPLPPRLGPTVLGVGGRVVVLGGRPDDRPCPPNASCVRDLREAPRDGAVYDVRADVWERLPDAPLPLDVASAAVVGSAVHLLLAGGEHLRLDLPAQRWEELPAPATAPGRSLRLVAAGDRLVAHPVEVGPADALDQAYDPRTRGWAALPAQPSGASFDRSMVWTGTQLVLVTAGSPPSPEDSGPRFVRAAVLDGGAWRVLPEQEVVLSGSLEWSWTGAHVVSASTQTADGGEVDGYGRSIPSGGLLDPARGTWSTLPPAPRAHERAGGAPYAAGGRWTANGEGLVLDAQEQRWLVLPSYDDQPDQDAGAAWAGGRLVVWGGAAGVRPAPEPDAARLLGTGAVWTPPQD